ncbi:MAG: hypothetical protein SPF07_03365 [Eubacteriales bacterium]|nr:hypothetical protein [Eubacteriales bacterium]
MKKSKILVLALTSVMATSVFGLAGCAGGGGDGGGSSTIEHTQHTYGNWEHNSTQHWRKCTSSGCTAEEREDHKYNGGYTCVVCGYVNESLKPGEPQSMSTYFSGMKTTSTRASVKDADNVTKSFDAVLDRQLDVLAQDLLYRLTYVYGYNETSHNRTENAKNTLFNGENAFSYNGNNAVVDSNKLLSSAQTTSKLLSANINKIEDFQKSIQVVSDDNYLLDSATINLSGAIEGRYMSIRKSGSSRMLYVDRNSDYAWNWYSDGNSTYSDFATKANINKMKMAIAQVLTNTTVDGNYSVDAYNNALAKIDALGFSTFDSAKLVKFIKSTVIGDTLVNTDDNYANTIKTIYSGIIDDDSLVDIDNNTTFTSNVATDSPRLYKGYSMVVPAIVKQALSNTFEGTTQTIYPTMSRYATDYSSNVFTTSISNFDSIVLAPRTSTPATKLVVKIDSTDNVELTIGCIVNGSNASSNQKKVRLSASGETVEFDLHSYSTIGAYNGSTEKDTNIDLFANNQTSKNLSDGTNYIKLVFTNPSNAKFRVTFTGYYNK